MCFGNIITRENEDIVGLIGAIDDHEKHFPAETWSGAQKLYFAWIRVVKKAANHRFRRLDAFPRF